MVVVKSLFGFNFMLNEFLSVTSSSSYLTKRLTCVSSIPSQGILRAHADHEYIVLLIHYSVIELTLRLRSLMNLKVITSFNQS